MRAAELQAIAEDVQLSPGFVVEQSSVDELLRRITKLERRIRMQAFGLLVLTLVGLGVLLNGLITEDVIVR